MSIPISDKVVARAIALVTDPALVATTDQSLRRIAWATLKLRRRQRIEAAATFRHQPGDAA